MDLFNINSFKQLLAMHESKWLDVMRLRGEFQFRPMPVAAGIANVSAHNDMRAAWTAHPQEMPALTAFQGLYSRKCLRPINKHLDDPHEKEAYTNKQAVIMQVSPAIKEAFEHCVNDYLSSVTNYFAGSLKTNDNEKSPEKKIDTETCRDANAAILLTFAIATGNQPITQKIIREIPGALDVFLCVDMIEPSTSSNTWIRPAAVILQLNAPDMVACLLDMGWSPAKKASVSFPQAPAENDFACAKYEGDKEGRSLFSMLVDRIYTETTTSPMLIDAISQSSQEIWRSGSQYWDEKAMEKLEYSVNRILSSKNSTAYGLVITKHLLTCGVLDWDVNYFAVTAAMHDHYDFLRTSALRLKWDDLKLEQARFIPTTLAQNLFHGGGWNTEEISKTIDILCSACINSGCGHMLVGLETDKQCYRPLIDFVKANCPNAVLMALEQGANPNDRDTNGYNAHWHVQNMNHTVIGEIISAHTKKHEAMSILDEMMNERRVCKP